MVRSSPRSSARGKQEQVESWTGELFLFEVVAEEEVLVAKVEFAPGDHWVRPAILIAPIRLIKAAFFFVGFWRRFDEHDGAAAAFATQIEMAVGIAYRPFAEFFVAPDHFASFEVLTNPAFAL